MVISILLNCILATNYILAANLLSLFANTEFQFSSVLKMYLGVKSAWAIVWLKILHIKNLFKTTY